MNVKLTIEKLGYPDFLWKKLILLLLFFVFCAQAFAQQQITGRVTDNNSGLPNATVRVKGTQLGTKTDDEGKFKLSVPDNAVLIFSYIGFTDQEIAVNGRKHIEVQLTEAAGSGLNEIVVVGYGTKNVQT
ncbi:carboxypeptidase-like regulatory domain-containing protein [Pedobacter panaciterrae]